MALPLGFQLDQSVTDGVANQSGDVVDVESLHQLRAVRFDRLDAQVQGVRDLLGGIAFGDHLQNFAVPRRQSIDWLALAADATNIVIDELLGDRWSQIVW